MFLNPQKIIDQFGIIPGMQVADLGAGSGAYAIALAKAVGDSGRVYAVDVKQNVLEELKADALASHFQNVDVVWGDLEEPHGSKLKDDFLDAVVISNLLFQLQNKDALALEAKRILKKGGRAFVIDWSDSFGGLGPVFGAIITEASAKEIFKRAGFEISDNLKAGDHHYGFVCKKL